MRHFIYSAFVTMTVLGFSTQGQAQKAIVEDTLQVKGVCGMCKERIEEAAYGKGVKYVSWDKVTDELAIAYRSDKTSLTEIEDRILAAGHSTQNREAKPEDYAKLPNCCKYEEKEKH